MRKLFVAFVSILLTLIMGVVVATAQENAVKTVNGGVLNGKAIRLPKPEYPVEARSEGVEGAVAVNITIDENGNVTSATALPNYQGSKKTDDGSVTEPIPANPILREAAEKAAMGARFAPTQLNGEPVKVKGMIVYNFVASKILEEQNVKTISGGVLNGKAINLPAPAYPPAARAVGAGGTVTVRVTIDEQGNVISAEAVSGHPLLQGAATEAARNATFAPTLFGGQAVKVSGVVTYTFVAGAKPENQ